VKHGFEAKIITDNVLLELSDQEKNEMMEMKRKDYLIYKLKKLKLLIDRDVLDDHYKDSYEETVKIQDQINYRQKAMDWTLAEISDWN